MWYFDIFHEFVADRSPVSDNKNYKQQVKLRIPSTSTRNTIALKALFLCVIYNVHNSIVIIIIIIIINIITIIINNKYYNIHSPLGIVSYWLFRNCAQKLGTRREDFEQIAEFHEIKTVFCWEIRAPRMSSL